MLALAVCDWAKGCGESVILKMQGEDAVISECIIWVIIHILCCINYFVSVLICFVELINHLLAVLVKMGKGRFLCAFLPFEGRTKCWVWWVEVFCRNVFGTYLVLLLLLLLGSWLIHCRWSIKHDSFLLKWSSVVTVKILQSKRHQYINL